MNGSKPSGRLDRFLDEEGVIVLVELGVHRGEVDRYHLL